MPFVPGALSPVQWEAFAAVAQHGAWRMGDAHFCEYSRLVSEYGLPDSQEKLHEFLRAQA